MYLEIVTGPGVFNALHARLSWAQVWHAAGRDTLCWHFVS